MIKVLLVDDEVLALHYLEDLIPWEENGFHIVGSATSGKRALELYHMHRPDIVVSDIRMTGMDGLELSKRIKEENPDTMIVLLSAYKDFEYAKKGIQYGVENYLLKHELSEETLLPEMRKLKERLIQNTEKEKIYQRHFMNQLVFHGTDNQNVENEKFGNRLFLIMIHRNNLFQNGNFYEQELEERRITEIRDVIEEPMEEMIFFVSDVKISKNNYMLLYRIENTVSKYKINTLIERKNLLIAQKLNEKMNQEMNLLYSYEIQQSEISGCFQQMSAHVRHSMFWKRGEVYALSKLPVIVPEEKMVWEGMTAALDEELNEENPAFEDVIGYLFEQVTYPTQKLDAAREMIHLIDNILRKAEMREGIERIRMEENIFKLNEIQVYYVRCYAYLAAKLHENEEKRYSVVVRNTMRYIRKNYCEELNQETLGNVFQMNGVYLGQIFKKEVGISCLKYLTNCRMEEAKRLLRTGEYHVGEVAEMVGYKTSQYFSQIFLKNVGMKPQEYKNGTKKE